MGKKGAKRAERRLRAAEGPGPAAPAAAASVDVLSQMLMIYQDFLPKELIKDVVAQAAKSGGDPVDLLQGLCHSDAGDCDLGADEVGIVESSDFAPSAPDWEEKAAAVSAYDDTSLSSFFDEDQLLALFMSFPDLPPQQVWEALCAAQGEYSQAFVWLMECPKTPSLRMIMDEEAAKSISKKDYDASKPKPSPYVAKAKAPASGGSSMAAIVKSGGISSPDRGIWSDLKDADSRGVPKASYSEIRSDVTSTYEKRNELIRRALKEFQAKRYAVGAELMDRARDMMSEIQDCERKAVVDTIVSRNPGITRSKPDKLVLDLHGLHVREAVSLVRETIAEKRRIGEHRLWVVTGVGRHSKFGVGKLKPAVERCLSGLAVRYFEEGEGAWRVLL